MNNMMGFQRMKSEMEIDKIRKDNYLQELEINDKEDIMYFKKEIEDPEVRENVIEIWKTSIKKDEYGIHDQWVKKIDSLRRAFEKDKRTMSEYDTNERTVENN